MGMCKYAIPKDEYRPTYPYPFKCSVMYECRYDRCRENDGNGCVRYQIGENMEIGKEKKCCGTCQHHRKCCGEWQCFNEQSENYAIETEYNDTCEDWEER